MTSTASGAAVSSRTGWAIGLMFGVAIGLGMGLGAVRRPDGGLALTPSRAVAAANPLQIPSRGWTWIFKRTLREFNEDQIPAVAAGVTFFALLSLFPALGAFASLYGLFANVDGARRQVASLTGLLPGGGATLIGDQMTRLAGADHGRLGATFLISLLLSLWTLNAGVKSLIAGLNVAYEERERRNFIGLNLASLGFTVSVVLFAVLGMAAAVAIPGVLALLKIPDPVGLSVLHWPILLLVVMGLLSLFYRYGPCREHAQWRWVTPGSAVASAGWLAMSLLFSLYVANFGHYDKIYGSLGAVVGFMTWIWLSLIVVLFGAELNSEIELQTSVDTTTEPARPRGQRGAAVADREI